MQKQTGRSSHSLDRSVNRRLCKVQRQYTLRFPDNAQSPSYFRPRSPQIGLDAHWSNLCRDIRRSPYLCNFSWPLVFATIAFVETDFEPLPEILPYVCQTSS